MTHADSIKGAVAKDFLKGLLALFLIPLLALLFVSHAETELDSLFLAAIEKSIDGNPRLGDGGRAEAKAFFRAHPPSTACEGGSEDFEKYKEKFCAPYSEVWQFHLVHKISFWTGIAGVALLLAILALGGAAFLNRRAQYVSFMLGWRLLILSSAAEIILQAALLVWLSYWVTAFFFHVYFVKLIVLAGVAAAFAVFYAVVCIFRRLPANNGVEGELLGKDEAPALWERVRSLAAQLGTAPPDQIIAGIDTNFFVTEAPLSAGGRKLTGRSLFVSLPLLRLLDQLEADAVLAHELAHFSGGDTASSAALGPKLAQFDQYCRMMHAAAVTVFAFYLLNMYRTIFEFALKRDSREREFLADRKAAALVSAQGIVHSLIKVGAYARYRDEIENKLFSHDARHGDSLGIAQQVASGLAPYAASALFSESIKSASIPHPFDSHPPLPERMANVGCVLPPENFGAVVVASAQTSWINDIPQASAIEGRLWDIYEKRFTAVHEQQLAYRYLPANEEETAMVLRYFPTQAFALRKGKLLEVSYEGIRLPGQSDITAWDSVADLKYEEGIGGDVLQIVHPEKGWLGKKSTKAKLPGIRKERARLKAVLGLYWHRHKTARLATTMAKVTQALPVSETVTP